MEINDAIHLLKVFLHDPPDKALDIRHHVSRTERYIEKVIANESVDKKDAQPADIKAAIAERAPPMPDWEGCSVGPEKGGKFTVFHSVSGAQRMISCGELNEKAVGEIIGEISKDGSAEQSLLALWRLLPERLQKELGDDWLHILADTRLPDHSIWHHNDIATAWAAATRRSGGAAFLSLSLGPVQGFIAAARSLRDLWTGSILLSWLIFQAMRPVLDECGPTAFIFPALRGNALADAWLRNEKGIKAVPETTGNQRLVAGLPNRFMALVPWETSHQLGEACEAAARKAWRDLSISVRSALAEKLDPLCSNWVDRWDEQIATLPEVSWVVVPEAELDKKELTRLGCSSLEQAKPIWALADAIPAERQPNYPQKNAGVWAAQIEAVGRIAEAARSIRPVPVTPARPGESHPLKCSILGSFDQMGPVDFEGSREFWRQVAEKQVSIDGVRIRKGERLCAISLTKRFAAPVCLSAALGVDRATARFPDTATIAAKEWLEKAKIDPGDYPNWNGRWLHGGEKEEEDDPCPPTLNETIRAVGKELGAPPAYYAILVADGDNMGDWLAGRKAPALSEVLHPKLKKYFKDLPDKKTVAKALDAKRPVGPALHAAISSALNHFAGKLAPQIAEKCHGVLIYAGGDDVLAMMPVSQALNCARALSDAFKSPEAMGEKASLSAGVAVVHYKEDLRQALDAARAAEKIAKSGGRDQVGLTVRRRSGEHALQRLSWSLAERFAALQQRFQDGMTDRWAYRLRSEASTLDGVQRELIRAELRRLLRRCSDGKVMDKDVETISGLFDDYTAWLKTDASAASFAVLCQSASFLARGRDR
ncbi:CRISPR-associated protein Cmr2 [Azospirillaceae bacterium]